MGVKEVNERLNAKLIVWIDANTKDILKKVSKARGEDMSDFVRRAVKMELARLSYLSAAEKKALGLVGGG